MSVVTFGPIRETYHDEENDVNIELWSMGVEAKGGDGMMHAMASVYADKKSAGDDQELQARTVELLKMALEGQMRENGVWVE